MPMDGSTKVKIVVAVAIAAVAYPSYMLTDGYLDAKADEYWEAAGGKPSAPARDSRPKDPEAAAKLWRIAWVYRTTFRSEKAEPILHDWILRFGGDDTAWEGDHFFPAEKFWDEDKNPRPDYYPTKPHPLTPKVVAAYAETFEHRRLYSVSRPLWELIPKHMADIDPAATKEAEKAILRDRTRTF